MAAVKLSVSVEEDLAGVVREAAAAEGVSVSAWVSSAVQDRIRNRLLRVALDDLANEFGPVDPEEAARRVAEARRGATVTTR